MRVIVSSLDLGFYFFTEVVFSVFAGLSEQFPILLVLVRSLSARKK